MFPHRIAVVLPLLGALTLGACKETVTEPPPPAATMTFKQGARYELTSWHTAADNPSQRSDSTSRTWTLSQTSATVAGRSNVAVYIDSIIAIGGTGAVVVDSVYLHQQSGTNDIYRYQSLAPELDLAGGATTVTPDLGRQWAHEARLNATTASWLVGETADTVQYDLGIPLLQGLKVSVRDSAVASATESITIGTETFTSTKTTHRLILGIAGLIELPLVGLTSVGLASESLTRTSWTVPELGAVVREEREGKVITMTYEGATYTLPIPGYASIMTRIVARGN